MLKDGETPKEAIDRIYHKNDNKEENKTSEDLREEKAEPIGKTNLPEKEQAYKDVLKKYNEAERRK